MATNPTTAREQWDCDRDNGFLDTGVFAETVTYDSPKDSISGRSISAVVQDADLGEDREYTVFVSDHATTGVGTLPTRGATFTLSGGEVMTIVAFESDEGIHTCRCRKAEEIN